MSGSKQNKEPEPQQSTAFTPTASSQECPMTVMKFYLYRFKCVSLQCWSFTCCTFKCVQT